MTVKTIGSNRKMMLTSKTVLLTIILAVAGCCTTESFTPRGVDITTVVNQVKSALVSTQKALVEEDMPGLASVEITLSLVKTDETSAEAKFLVLSGGPTRASSKAQKIAITLKPPAKDAKEDVSGADLRQALVDAIVAAGRTSSAARRAASTGEPKLVLTSVATSVKFSVTDTDDVGVGIEIGGLKLGVEHSSVVGDSHEIEFTFE